MPARSRPPPPTPRPPAAPGSPGGRAWAGSGPGPRRSAFGQLIQVRSGCLVGPGDAVVDRGQVPGPEPDAAPRVVVTGWQHVGGDPIRQGRHVVGEAVPPGDL